MGYGNRCPTCLRPWQRGSGIVSSFSSIAKRAMARELGRKMAAATLAVQKYGNQRQSKQRGSGLVKTIFSSKPVRTVGKAVVEALAGKAVDALTSPKEKQRRQRQRQRRKNPQSKKRKRPPVQSGSGIPLLALMASAAPLIGKSAGLAALGTLVNHGVQKALGR